MLSFNEFTQLCCAVLDRAGRREMENLVENWCTLEPTDFVIIKDRLEILANRLGV